MDTIREGVEQVVNEIFQRDGYVKPSVLVDEARSAASPAHSAFEWDDNKAGNEYRLIQARGWIRKVSIIVEDRAEEMIHVPVIVGAEEREGYYKPISQVRRCKDELEMARGEALTRLKAAKSAYDRLGVADEKLNRKASKGFSAVESAIMQQAAV
jgi:hypothetical protein